MKKLMILSLSSELLSNSVQTVVLANKSDTYVHMEKTSP